MSSKFNKYFNLGNKKGIPIHQHALKMQINRAFPRLLSLGNSSKNVLYTTLQQNPE